MATKDEMAVVTVKLPAVLKGKAMARARLMDVTVSQVVRKALREFVKDGDDSSSAA